MHNINISLIQFIIFSLILLNGCKAQESSMCTNTIDIESSKDAIPYTEFIDRIEATPIINDRNSYFSAVEDICVGESSIYVLDATSNLVKINTTSGKVEKKINIKGHSAEECIEPKAITCTNDNIYVLDMHGMKILTLDNDLNYISTTPTPVSSSDFAVIPNGFLLFNLNCGKGDDLIVTIDKKGKIQNEFISNSGLPQLILTQHILSETNDGVAIVPPLQKKMFHYDNRTDSISCENAYNIYAKGNVMTFGRSLKLPDTPTIAFESERFIITNYFADSIIGTCVYDKRKQNTLSGLIKTETQYPFAPMVLKNNILYAVYDGTATSPNGNDPIIMKYVLKK